MQDENGNNNLRKILKGLPKVKAKDDFENHLYKRLRDVESEKFSSPALKRLTFSGKRFSLASLLKPSLIPAVGLTIVLLIFLAYYFNLILINKNTSNQEVSKKTDTIQLLTGSQNPNKDTEKQITGNDIQKSKQDAGISEGFHSSDDRLRESDKPSIESESKESESISTPKVEIKASDELKMEEKKVEDRKFDFEKSPVMNKSGEIRSKDSGNQIEGNLDKEKDQSKEEGQIDEQKNENIDVLSTTKTDSTKAKIHGKKHLKKEKNYRDTVKTDNNLNQEDSTKNK